MKVHEPYVTLTGREIPVSSLSKEDQAYLGRLAAMAKKRGADYFELLRQVTGTGAYPVKGGRLTPEVMTSPVYSVARDIVDRLGVEQAVVLDPNADTHGAPTIREIPDLVSLSEAAKIIGITRPSTHQALKEGRLRGIQVGNAWVMRKIDVVAFKEKSERSSSPRKPREKRKSAAG